MRKALIFGVLVVFASTIGFCYDFTITIPDPLVSRVVNALARHYNYASQIPDENGDLIDNPETKAQFVQRMIKQEMKQRVIRQEAIQSSRDAYDSSRNSGEAEIDIQ